MHDIVCIYACVLYLCVFMLTCVCARVCVLVNFSTQLSHKLLIRCMGALKSGVKSGNAEHKATGDNEGMVKALVELASFCDEQLRLKEDEGNCISMDTYILSLTGTLITFYKGYNVILYSRKFLHVAKFHCFVDRSATAKIITTKFSIRS